jgi:hypothetical protein
MSISRKPKPVTPSTADVDAFISGAPDANAGSTTAAPVGVYQKGIAKGHKRQISLTIAPDLLQRVDELAKRTGQGRAGIINLAIYQALEGDVFKA